MKNKVPVTNTDATKVLRRVLIQNVLKKVGTGIKQNEQTWTAKYMQITKKPQNKTENNK